MYSKNMKMKFEKSFVTALTVLCMCLFVAGMQPVFAAEKGQSIYELELGNMEQRQQQQFLDRLSDGLVGLSNNPIFREVLYEEVNKQFDGEYNVLFSTLVNRSFERGLNILAEMEEYVGPTCKGDVNFKLLLDKFARRGNFPHVYIPMFHSIREGSVNAVRLGTKNPVIVTDVVGQHVVVAEGRTLSPNGRHVSNSQVDRSFALDNEVWVVALNERVDSKGIVHAKILEGIAESKLAESYVALPKTVARTASTGRHVRLNSINLPDISELEGWTRGGPELWVKIIDLKKNQFGHHYFHMSRSSISNRWWYANRYLGYWDYTARGRGLYFSWYEEDGGNDTQSVTIGWKISDAINLSFTFKIGSKDDQGGGMGVTPESYGYTFNTGKVKFRLN